MHALEKTLIKTELRQRREEGCDVAAIEQQVAQAFAEEAPNTTFKTLYDDLMALPIEASFPYDEPSTLAAIQQARPKPSAQTNDPLDADQAAEQIHGGWLGRAVGCCLGKPVEGWKKARIETYLTDIGALPLNDYIPFSERLIANALKSSTRGNIQCMDRDDDMDFTVLGLLALERKGAAVSPRTIANTWSAHMPLGLTYTAEKVAYRNFALGIWPPHSALFRNPFREWIGAQIRADVFGYVAPGQPQKAAALAFQDASISHAKNGVYGEMFIAAMIAAAFAAEDADSIVDAGLGEIPKDSRLAVAIRATQAWCQQEMAASEPKWQNVWENINEHYGHYHGVHTINNAAVVVMGVYFGFADFEQGIVVTTLAGWDTDCNAATVGSILGVKFGAKALPNKWTEVLNDRLISAVRGENHNTLSQLAKRTVAVAATMSATAEAPKVETLSGDASGIWELDTGWGAQLLKLSEGTIYLVDNELGPFNISGSSLVDGALKFSFAIDKGDWDFTVDFEGRLDGDQIEGSYYPGVVPVSGRRMSHA